MGRENNFSVFVQGSVVFEWNPETSKAHHAIIFVLNPQNSDNYENFFKFFLLSALLLGVFVKHLCLKYQSA